MAYEKNTWVNGDASRPLDAIRLNHVEDGIFLAAARADLAASGVADLETLTTSGRLGETELTDTFARGVSVVQFGAVGDGTTDDTAAFTAALAAAKHVYVPQGSYKITAALTTASGQKIWGAGKNSSVLLHAFNGHLFPNLASYTTIEDLSIDGQGATFTGRCFDITGTAAQQSITRVRAMNFDGEVVYFALSAGSGFTATDCLFYRVNAATTTDRFAIVIEDAEKLTAVPRKFIALETGGTCAIHFGGSNNTEVIGSILGDLGFSAESRGVNINSSRLLNDLALTVNGHGVTIVGCDVLPAITIASGADSVIIGPNAYNNLPVIDNSGNPRNQVTHHRISYTPVLTASGGGASLGVGTLTGIYSRAGTALTCELYFTVGADTVLGSGYLEFTLPTNRPAFGSNTATPGTALITIGSTVYAAFVQIHSTSKLRLILVSNGQPVTGAAPGALVSGSVIRASWTYQL